MHARSCLPACKVLCTHLFQAFSIYVTSQCEAYRRYVPLMNSRKSHSPRILRYTHKAVREMNRSLARYYRPEIFSESVENGCLRGKRFQPFRRICQEFASFRQRSSNDLWAIRVRDQRESNAMKNVSRSQWTSLIAFTLDQRPWISIERSIDASEAIMRGGDRSISEYTLCFRYLMLDHELENLYFPRTARWRDTLRRF